MDNIKNVVEALIFSSGTPLSKKDIVEKIPELTPARLTSVVKELQKKYSGESDRRACRAAAKGPGQRLGDSARSRNHMLYLSDKFTVGNRIDIPLLIRVALRDEFSHSRAVAHDAVRDDRRRIHRPIKGDDIIFFDRRRIRISDKHQTSHRDLRLHAAADYRIQAVACQTRKRQRQAGQNQQY